MFHYDGNIGHLWVKNQPDYLKTGQKQPFADVLQNWCS